MIYPPRHHAVVREMQEIAKRQRLSKDGQPEIKGFRVPTTWACLAFAFGVDPELRKDNPEPARWLDNYARCQSAGDRP